MSIMDDEQFNFRSSLVREWLAPARCAVKQRDPSARTQNMKRNMKWSCRTCIAAPPLIVIYSIMYNCWFMIREHFRKCSVSMKIRSSFQFP